MKNKKLLAILLIALVSMFVLTACAYDATLFSNVDFANSPYKHVTNGGKGGEDPYNISAITGATLTIEGPGMQASVPLSTKELENQNDGLARGVYKDKNGTYSYEGIDVYYLLNEMGDGDSAITMTDTAFKVVFKNANRETIAELTLKDIEKAHKDGQPVLITYGMGTEDGKTTVAPYVFSGANEGEHTKGYVEALDNEDGCLKLVYNYTKYGKNKQYKEFSNCAYLYVMEENTPGFKHNADSGEAYADPKLTNYVISISGTELGSEIDFTVEQLEALVNYNKDGTIKEGGLGYKDSYSLANNTYWYVNEYEGLDLYKLLRYVGMPSAESYEDDADDTFVTFYASDGYTSAEKFSLAKLADPNNFGYYKKNSADLNDGTYESTNADLVKTGYPVMLAYGVNSYPYTITNGDDGFIAGLSNNGGPMRVIFGKTEYAHANGSNQIQYLADIVVGGKDNYSTHKDSRNAAVKEFRDSKLKVVVNNVDGKELSNNAMTVTDIENIIYSADVTANTIKNAKVKSVYEVSNGKDYDNDIYEGISLEYFISEVVGVPGTNGKVTFSNGKEKYTVDMNDLFAGGVNVSKGITDQKAIIAFAKNGAPLVDTNKNEGYVASRTLTPVAESDPAEYKVDNAGGPLAIIIPSSNEKESNATSVMNVTSITIDIEPDKYAHLDGEAAELATTTFKVTGEGVNADKEFTVSDVEGMQKLAQTIEFGNDRFRGVPIYEILLDTGLRYNANEVIITSTDGSSETFKVGDLRPKDGLKTPLVAYGVGDPSKALKEGAPLLEKDGGPLMFVSDGKTVKSIASIEVTAIEMASWNHSDRELYTEFLDSTFTITIKKGDVEKSKVFTLKEIEAMTDIVERTEYTVLDLGACEGVNIWKLVLNTFGSEYDLSNPISVNAYATDGYSKDLLSIFSMEALEKGIVSADGSKKPIILCYAIQGYPLVLDENDEGYTGLVANADGPMRFITETNQGASLKWANKLVVTLE